MYEKKFALQTLLMLCTNTILMFNNFTDGDKSCGQYIWSRENTSRLIHLVKDNYDLLTGKGHKRSEVFENIAKALNPMVCIV